MADKANHSYYEYDPSTAAAIAVASLYGASFLVSLLQTIRYKAWVWLVMVLAVGMETVGFVARIKSTNDTTDRNSYIAQFCLIILAPVLMAATTYVAFGRIVFHVVPTHARRLKLLWVPPRFVTPIFVGFDMLALFTQMVGAIMVSSTQITDDDAAEKLERGRDIAMAGIAIQMAAFGLFTIIAARFQFTSKRFIHDVAKKLHMSPGEKKAAVEGCDREIRPNWRVELWAINSACLLILLRSIYRMIEFDQGKTGEVSQHEYYMYIFDVIPIFTVCVIFNVCHPGAYLPFMGFRLPKSERTLPGSDTESARFELVPNPPEYPSGNTQQYSNYQN